MCCQRPSPSQGKERRSTPRWCLLPLPLITGGKDPPVFFEGALLPATGAGRAQVFSHFLKGIFNCRPPAPKYSFTWDVDIVLSYIRDLPSNEDLSFQLLSHKVAMLMALANADRSLDRGIGSQLLLLPK